MEKKELEGKFSEFLIQKIKQAGGSLPLQHLFGYLQYATFEMRKEFGTTRRELMKFLKAHSEVFYIDPSGGMVTVISSFSTISPGSDENDGDEDDEDINTEESTATRGKNIENGFGYIIKLHPEFGIIKAVEPFETDVYFKSDVFIGSQDKLLTECLEVEFEVCFNAVYGHNDLDIKFLATKVWRNRNDNFDDIGENQKALSKDNDFEGDGVVQKIFSDKGFILVSGKKKESVFFDKSNVIDRNGMELAKFLKVGDPVSFSASKSNETNSKSQWRATVVRKKSKEKLQSTSHSKIKAAVKNKIENEQGKIHPHSHGAIIKFRNNELADGDSSKYFLYGIEVTDIGWEFSEGDDVWFDAVKTKSAPGWKAVCVWVGEKPEYVNRKIDSDEEIQDISDNSSASYQKNNLTVNLKSKTLKSDDETPILQQIQSKSPVFDLAGVKDSFLHDFECKRQNSESHRNFQNFSTKKSYKGGGINPRKEVIKKNKISHNEITSERLVKPRSNLRNLTVNKLKNTTMELKMEMDHTSSHLDDDLSYTDEESDISEKSFPSSKFQDMLQKGENFLRERYKNVGNEYQSDSESDIDNADVIKHSKSFLKGRSSIKTFEDIKGEIKILHCKVAMVKCSELQGDVHFLINDFYVNGKSVEEEQVIDLKEIIKVGDHVNINCFEIIDDLGQIHHKVTLAWKGSKPNVYEMTPKEFIDEFKLSVTLSDELVPEYFLEDRKSSQNSLEETSEETAVIEHSPADFSNDVCESSQNSLEETSEETAVIEHSSADFSNDVCNIQTKQHIKIAEIDKHNFEENNLSIDTHKSLSEMIIHRLKSKGLISADLQADFSDVLTQIVSLTQKHGDLNSYKNSMMTKGNMQQKVCSTCAGKKGSVFSCKNKQEKHAGVQTIITGGIIAQSIYTQN